MEENEHFTKMITGGSTHVGKQESGADEPSCVNTVPYHAAITSIPEDIHDTCIYVYVHPSKYSTSWGFTLHGSPRGETLLLPLAAVVYLFCFFFFGKRVLFLAV